MLTRLNEKEKWLKYELRLLKYLDEYTINVKHNMQLSKRNNENKTETQNDLKR
jgi:hypothetical protein